MIVDRCSIFEAFSITFYACLTVFKYDLNQDIIKHDIQNSFI